LTWEDKPEDLDLHLKIFSPRNTFEISYSEQGTHDEEPWAQLDEDVQSGFGPENIAIKRWFGDKYHCAVRNYSQEPQLAGCNALLKFKCGNVFLELRCPNEGSGLWWDIFILDAKTEELTIINKIVESPSWQNLQKLS
jgi:hypothetical protein